MQTIISKDASVANAYWNKVIKENTMPPKVHRFAHPVESISLPERFTYPFHYSPHPLTLIAASEVQAYLHTRTDWQKELEEGKMFGVLIVRTAEKHIGYLAAFSGNLAGSNNHRFFVPPVYDLLQPEGFFKQEEKNITAINLLITEIENDPLYKKAKVDLKIAEEAMNARLSSAREAMKAAKAQREALRKTGLSPQEEDKLIRESQFQKAEFKRLGKSLKNKVEELSKNVSARENRLIALKSERKNRSAALQQKLFTRFRMLNAQGETKDLCELFRNTPQQVPPAGAGECALPKLLQYAYQNGLEPLAMGEFWWGKSPKTEIRHHGSFYPSCKGKCEPILCHMLKGLSVDDNPLEKDTHRDTPLDILFEDDYLLVVNKPAGMLSAPGKSDIESVSRRLRNLYPEDEILIAHRLDMATSGLLLVAKNKNIYQDLQRQFEARTIKKRYTALLSGVVKDKKGSISLPLAPDYLHRPRQTVDYGCGKPAFTRYEVAAIQGDVTRIHFYPLTGRTHQLRVHAAHPQGLNCPIVGDTLYGKAADRLYLHADELTFEHPVTRKIIHLTQEADF